jgi:hypothetical protein
MQVKVKDNDLSLFSKCNLLDIGPLEPEFQAACKTVKWCLLSKFGNKVLTKGLISLKFESEYITFFINKEKDKVYWAGIKAGRRFTSKLFWLLTKYSVLQPIQTYNYSFPDGKTYSGEYSIIQRKSETEKPLVLILSRNRPLHYNYPNLSDIAKWLHSKTNYLDIGIYHFAMFRGDDWKEKSLFEPLIYNWIYSILLQISNDNKYINAGSHCNSCLSKKCLGGQNG